ncbi:MAG: extracellular solute-binding protein [Candidatus Kaiserbacteria bacterium]|nr:extracellular solute-binding protein [Candidatus Kaiserbacteria bacterium]
MDQKTFQAVLYVFFGILFLGGFLSLSLYGYFKKAEQDEGRSATVFPNIVIWGTFDAKEMAVVSKQLSRGRGEDKGYNNVRYVEKDPSTVRSAFIQAAATGQAPDLLLLDHRTLLTLRENLRVIPFSAFPLAQYQRTFIPASDQFVVQGGYLGFPFLADTMVLYYNENLRLRDGIKDIPTTWSEFSSGALASVIKRHQATDRSVIPLGSYSNYQHAIELLSALVLQTKESDAGLTAPALQEALEFYTSFSNLRSSVFTWNVSLPQARDLFVANNLIFYPGFISEYQELIRSNPNIVVRVAPIPQIGSGATPVTPAVIHTLGIAATSKQPTAALSVILDLLSILQEEETGFLDRFPAPPALQGFYPDAESDVTETIFISSLFDARAIPLTPEQQRQLITILQEIVVGSRSYASGVETLLRFYQ